MEIELNTPKTPNSSFLKRTAKTPSKTPTKNGDRFIPARGAMDLDVSHWSLVKENEVNSPLKEDYNAHLADTMFDGKLPAKILAFKSKAPAPNEAYQNSQRVLYSANKSTLVHKKSNRHIPTTAEKVLDAPDFVDDYYLHLLDWSAYNVVSIGLGTKVYLWNAGNGEIQELLTTEDSNPVTSLKWTKEGRHIAVGFHDGVTQLWDAQAIKPLRNLKGHAGRIASMSWNNHLLTTGSADTAIHNHDVRIAQHLTSKLSGHTQEVCGLAWNEDGSQLASGGNDNFVNIWNMNDSTPAFQLTEHQAAVKALAWCPWQKDLLATGGGTADRTIKFWNSTTGACLNSIDTESQVSSLVWSKNPAIKEIVSGHGFSHNQICVWKYPSLTKAAELRGHTARVLEMAMSPDGQTVVSGAADETLRFWKIFGSENTVAATPAAAVAAKPKSTSSLGAKALNIR